MRNKQNNGNRLNRRKWLEVRDAALDEKLLGGGRSTVALAGAVPTFPGSLLGFRFNVN